MKSFNTLLIITLMMLSGACLFGEITQPPELDSLNYSVATANNVISPIFNPAFLGTKAYNGIGYLHLFDSNMFKDHYWFTLNKEGLSYTYEKYSSLNHHTVAIGNELFPRFIIPNTYWGTSYSWENSKTNEGNFRSGILYRPHNSTSLGFVWDNVRREAPAYKFGLGVRPFAFVNQLQDYRISLSADYDYHLDKGDYKFFKPTIGVQSQVIDGLNIGGSYSFEDKKALLNFSISAKKAEMGTIVKTNKQNNDSRYGMTYLYLSDDDFIPIFKDKTSNWYDLKLEGKVVTYRSPKYSIGFLNIYEKDIVSIESIIHKINKAKDDPTIKGILIKNPSISISLALMQELLKAFKEFKACGKSVVVYYDNMSNGEYIFASSIADKIYLNPNGFVDLRGLSINLPYFKNTLDALGIEVMNFRSHPFKTAGNNLSEPEMTEEEREEYNSLLNSIYTNICSMMESNRKFSKPINEIIDNGPYWISENAYTTGLVDTLIYADQLDKQIKKDFPAIKKQTTYLVNYKNYDWAKEKENLVAMIYAQGNIVGGKGPVGQKIAQETTVDIIRKARKNPIYKGIILRIDSGGGSAQASDIIWHELELAKTENKKHIVVSMAGVAASGGYYIACNADTIVADPMTITGSIGVVGITFNAERLFKKVRVNWSTVKRGEHSDFGTTHRAWTEEEKKIFSDMIASSYEDFVGKVAKGRSMTVDSIKTIAQGKVWTGEQALQNGLVDVLGGLDEAVNQMRKIANIKGDITLIDATSKKGGIEVVMDNNSLIKATPLGLLIDSNNELIKLYEMWRDYSNDSLLMISPVDAQSIK